MNSRSRCWGWSQIVWSASESPAKQKTALQLAAYAGLLIQWVVACQMAAAWHQRFEEEYSLAEAISHTPSTKSASDTNFYVAYTETQIYVVTV